MPSSPVVMMLLDPIVHVRCYCRAIIQHMNAGRLILAVLLWCQSQVQCVRVDVICSLVFRCHRASLAKAFAACGATIYAKVMAAASSSSEYEVGKRDGCCLAVGPAVISTRTDMQKQQLIRVNIHERHGNTNKHHQLFENRRRYQRQQGMLVLEGEAGSRSATMAVWNSPIFSEHSKGTHECGEGWHI